MSPGTYTVTVSRQGWCWTEQSKEVAVDYEDVSGVSFQQSGYRVEVDQSHAFKFKFSRVKGGKKQKSKGLLLCCWVVCFCMGVQRLIFLLFPPLCQPKPMTLRRAETVSVWPTPGRAQTDHARQLAAVGYRVSSRVCAVLVVSCRRTYELQPVSCYRFAEESFTFDTASPTVLELHAEEYEVFGYVAVLNGQPKGLKKRPEHVELQVNRLNHMCENTSVSVRLHSVYCVCFPSAVVSGPQRP